MAHGAGYGRPSSNGVGKVVIALMLMAALLGFVGVLAMEAMREAGKSSGQAAPILKGPAEPFKTPYTGSQSAEEPPPAREIYKVAQPGKAAPPPAAPPAPVPVAKTLDAGGPPRFATEGAFVAQLGAFGSEATARDAWVTLAARAGGSVSGAKLDVQRAEKGDGVVLHRLRAGYFADRATATRFCGEMKAMGQDCIVAAR